MPEAPERPKTPPEQMPEAPERPETPPERTPRASERPETAPERMPNPSDRPDTHTHACASPFSRRCDTIYFGITHHHEKPISWNGSVFGGALAGCPSAIDCGGRDNYSAAAWR